MAFWAQQLLLLWNNFLHRRRQPIQLPVELLWPLFLILMAVNHSHHPPLGQYESKPLQGPGHFLKKPLPSSGTIPWLQDHACNVNNTCCPQRMPSEEPGILGTFNYSFLGIGVVGVEAWPRSTSNPGPACAKLRKALNMHPLSHLLWRCPKPLVLGELMFVPDTLFTQQLMAQVNQTFQDLALLKDIQEVLGVLGPQLFNFMNDSANVVILWHKACADVEHLVGKLGRAMECMALDKLEAAPLEAGLVEWALELLAQHGFWAGVTFLDPKASLHPERLPGPSHLRVKIHMDNDLAADPLISAVCGGASGLLGGSCITILDEPAAGVPVSCRNVWELPLKYREGCTLTLSPHHLDEAKLLGDQGAVVTGGRLCCCGSPLFLRHHLGSGYYQMLEKGFQSMATSTRGGFELPALSPQVLLKVLEDCAVDTDSEAGAAPDTQALRGSGPDVVGQAQGWTLTCQQLWALLLNQFLLASLWPNSTALLEELGLENRYLQNSSHSQVPTALPCSCKACKCMQPITCQLGTVAEVLASGNQTLESASPACRCSWPGTYYLLPNCPTTAGGPPPPQAPTTSGEIVQNLMGWTLSDFLVKTYPHVVPGLRLCVLLSPQPGGALGRILNNLTAWAHGLDAQHSVKPWFNLGWHAVVAFVRASNALLHAHLPPGPDCHAHSVPTLNHPLNLPKEQLPEATPLTSSVDLGPINGMHSSALSSSPASAPRMASWVDALISTCMVFVMSFISASLTLALIEEHVTQAKQLYCSVTPLTYPASSSCSVPSMACVALTCFNLFIGINGSTATFMLELVSDQKGKKVSRILKQVFLIFPHFCRVGSGLVDTVRNQAMADAFERFGDRQFQSSLCGEVVGKNLLAMVVQGPLLTLLLQHCTHLLPQSVGTGPGWQGLGPSFGPTHTSVLRPKLRPLHSSEKEDEDVVCEEQVVGATQGDMSVLQDLTEGPALLPDVPLAENTAVDHQCLGIILASVTQDLAAALCDMGYCPPDATFELLTGQEHLEQFACLRGIPEAKTVQTLIGLPLANLGLQQHADQPAGTDSGGNKQKLATAVALVGDPAVVFLDEPTTGMYPSARHFLWNCVWREATHSTCLAVVVNGRFRCLWMQHLEGSCCCQEGAAPLVYIFGELAAPGAERGMEDFSVSQTSLKEVPEAPGRGWGQRWG
ncbi:LOW QUALITY PROTEIN: phospholipid-transporting ATPase ABCA7 [Glossophaga mutica]